MRLLLCLTALFVVVGCKAAGTESGVKETVATEQVPEVPGYLFVGCRPSAGECRNSCADHRYLPRTETSAYCEGRIVFEGDYECHCLIGDGTGDGSDPTEPPTPY